MSDRDERERLFDELWPCPTPRRDLAERVLARLEQSGDSNRERTRPRVVPPLAPPSVPRLVPFTSPVTSRKGKTGSACWWAPCRWPRRPVFSSPSRGPGWTSRRSAPQGQQVARERVTISIADRAAAAMEPGADLIWTVQKQRVRVEQRRGSVFYRVDRGDKFRVTTPSGDVEVTGTCFRVSLGAASTLSAMVTMVSVLEGSVKVSSGPDGQTLSVQAGETVRLEAGQPPIAVSESALPGQAQQREQLESDRQLREQAAATEARLRALEEILAQQSGRGEPAPPPRSALLLPPSTRLRVFGNELGRVSLSLPGAGKGRAATVEVARDPGFKRPIFSGPARDAYVTVPAPARGDLYWRLTGSAELAGHARFLPDRRRSQPLRRPHNLVSEGAERTTIYFQDAPPAVTLAFAATPGASRYRIRIHREDDPQRPLFDRTVAEPRCPVEPGLLGEGRYQWSVQPLDAEGLPLGQAGPPAEPAGAGVRQRPGCPGHPPAAARSAAGRQDRGGGGRGAAGGSPVRERDPGPAGRQGALRAEAGRRPPRPRVPAAGRRRHRELLDPQPAPALVSRGSALAIP